MSVGLKERIEENTGSVVTVCLCNGKTSVCTNGIIVAVQNIGLNLMVELDNETSIIVHNYTEADINGIPGVIEFVFEEDEI